ncbi:PREDICTED: probable WRKY transcription factor 53 [Ipomoea nil]|uniref:probable WRKY transcription factor 53 n=1 Tax=Ipomoea nil TaxID=35883 RepID=UPI000900E14D|nr:PREDICTED: probable WRKY transcription factor 53 [Ipomoea nil]
MEKEVGVDGEFNLNDLIMSELLQGRDAAKRLHMCLQNNAALLSSSSQDWSCEVLANKVQCSLDNALCMLNHAAGRNESSDSDREVRDATSGRRRKAAVWTDHVQVSHGEGLEEAHDDGYNWRKYGQKKIMGAQFPKGYYRCSHLYSRGCLAKKEIQKSDDDPTVFNVRYRGNHTCNNPSPRLQSPPPPRTLDNEEPPSTLQTQQEDNLLNLRRNLKIKTDNIEASSHGRDENPFPSSSYDFASSSGGIKVGEIHCGFPQPPTTTVVGNSFVSPATSGSSCFTMSPTTTTTQNLGSQFVPTTSDLEMIMEIPTATSGTNSPVVGMGFPFDATMAFDFTFTFHNNNPGFFD